MNIAITSLTDNPFPGLRPFREDEEHLFFGRENQVDAMVDKLAATHFLAVVGTSGSGKSSLVNCGLRPALRRGLMARAGTAWRMAQFRPGNNPIGAMAQALAKDNVLFSGHKASGLSLAEIIETNLRMSKLGLIDIFEQAALGEGVNLLVVVDQFEELFRYRLPQAVAAGGEHATSEQAVAFVNLLVEIKERAADRIFVVLTMRSDFLGDCTQFPGLAEAINAGQYLVPRMTRDERRAAIECPVGVGGAQISPVLLTRLVNDVGDNPDQLSILQHALNRTWARWQNEDGKGPIDLVHYEAIGTMAHALDHHAERAYAQLGSARQQQICEKLFKALTDATDPRGVRRPTALGTLCALAGATAEEVTGVIDIFRKPSRSFLMPPAGEALTAATIIDISHESLMRVWERLKKWASEEAQAARTYRRLAETAELYAAGNANLWRDPELQLALDWRAKNQPNETWASRYHPGFAAATAFLEESREAREAERAERQRQRTRELDDAREKAEFEARKAKNARRILWAATSCFALVAIAFFLWWQANQATALAHQATAIAQASEREAQITKLRVLINAANRSDPSAQILLALEGLPNESQKIDQPVAFAMDTLSKGINQLHERAVLGGHSDSVVAVAVTPKGERIVTGSADTTAYVWDGNTRDKLFTLKHDGAVLAVAITPDARRIVTGSDDKSARVWDGSGHELFRLDNHGGAVLAVAVTPDGGRIVTGANDGSVHVWDGTTGTEQFRLDGHTGPVMAAAITPDGGRIVTGSEDKSARVWDAGTHAELFRLEGHTAPVLAVATSPDGGRIVTASTDRSVRVWENGRQVQMVVLRGHSGRMLAVAVMVEGNRVVTGSDDNAVRVWSANGRGLPLELKGHADVVRAVAITADGKQAVTVSDDNTARVWIVGLPLQDELQFDTLQHRQATIDRAKAVVPRCLTIEERRANLLAPQPPAWCIEMRKYPFDTQLWRDWSADKNKKLSVVDSKVARAYGDFADAALKAADFWMAQDAANLGMAFDPSQTWITINLATAHMFLGYTKQAHDEYLAHRGERILDGARGWEEAITEDFAVFRKMGLTDPLMKEVESEFKSPPPGGR
jgi:WD domain, G-beta repeat